MGKKIETTKRQAIENCLRDDGETYFQKISEGWTTEDFNELLADWRVGKCEACKSWDEKETNGGNGEPTICRSCLENSLHKNAIEARRILRECDGHDIKEPEKHLEENRKTKLKKQLMNHRGDNSYPLSVPKFNSDNSISYVGPISQESLYPGRLSYVCLEKEEMELFFSVYKDSKDLNLFSFRGHSKYRLFYVESVGPWLKDISNVLEKISKGTIKLSVIHQQKLKEILLDIKAQLEKA